MGLVDVDENSEIWQDLQKLCKPREEGLIQRNDRTWRFAVTNYRDALEELKLAQATADAMRQELIELSGSSNSTGCGVKVQKIMQQGRVDYSAIGALEGIDLEIYRKPPKETWRITLEE